MRAKDVDAFVSRLATALQLPEEDGKLDYKEFVLASCRHTLTMEIKRLRESAKAPALPLK